MSGRAKKKLGYGCETAMLAGICGVATECDGDGKAAYPYLQLAYFTL